MDENIKAKIKQLIDEKVRPGIQMDGGDVELVEVTDDGIVKVKLTGHCVGCPMAGLTLFMGVERTLKQEIPEVSKVELVEESDNPPITPIPPIG
jgi:Fe-S cluster biogenesis protein NfuA